MGEVRELRQLPPPVRYAHLHDEHIETHDLAGRRVTQADAVEAIDLGEQGRELEGSISTRLSVLKRERTP